MAEASEELAGCDVMSTAADPGRVGEPAEESLIIVAWSGKHEKSTTLCPQVTTLVIMVVFTNIRAAVSDTLISVSFCAYIIDNASPWTKSYHGVSSQWLYTVASIPVGLIYHCIVGST